MEQSEVPMIDKRTCNVCGKEYRPGDHHFMNSPDCFENDLTDAGKTRVAKIARMKELIKNIDELARLDMQPRDICILKWCQDLTKLTQEF